MGYYVGNNGFGICYLTKEQAEDAYFSKVVAHVDSTGVHQLIRRPDGWYFGTHKVQSHLLQCDPAKSVAEGAEFAGYFLLPLAVAWGFNLIRNILK